MAENFRTVRKNTVVIAEEIPEVHYGFRVAPETRTVAQTLLHVTAARKVQEQIQAIERRSILEGFDFPGLMQRLMAEEQRALDKSQITACCVRRASAGPSGWRFRPMIFLNDRV